MSTHNHLRDVLQQEARTIQPPSTLKEKVMARVQGKKRARVKRWVTVAVAACLLLPTGAFAGYSYLADQVMGSSEQFKRMGGNGEDYNHLESKLVAAQKELGVKEFAAFIGLLKDMTVYHVKMVGLNGSLDINRLNAEDRIGYEQVLKEIQPYFDRLNESDPRVVKMEAISLEEAKKKLSFPVMEPSYVPEGYQLFQAYGYVPEMNKNGEPPSINIQYQKGSDTLLVLEYEQREKTDHMPQKFDDVKEYQVGNYEMQYGEGGRRGMNGLTLWVPPTSAQQGYQVYVAGKMSKDELERVALSIVE